MLAQASSQLSRPAQPPDCRRAQFGAPIRLVTPDKINVLGPYGLRVMVRQNQRVFVPLTAPPLEPPSESGMQERPLPRRQGTAGDLASEGVFEDELALAFQ